MMRNVKFVSFLLIIALMCSMATAYAQDNVAVPYADTEFSSAYPNLTSSKSVTFHALTYDIKNEIKVTYACLEQKVYGEWTYVCDLPEPSLVSYNTIGYTASVNYSSYIGSGTYRVGATFDADGHSISRYSNERTF